MADQDWSKGDLVVQSSDMALMNVASLAHSGALDLSPRFQRRNRWERDRQSRLIESFLLNVPVPPVYLAEERRGRFAVIDGKQRLTAISRFLNNEFRLAPLTFLPELEGRTFEELSPTLQSTLNMRPLRAVTVMRQTPEWMKYEVFIRLNSGGQPLNPQEIRNVAFAGTLNDTILDLSSDDFLRQQLKIRSNTSPAYADMTDVEYVLRFLALSTSWRHFSGSFKTTLDDFMLSHYQDSEAEVTEFEQRFLRALRATEDIWGDHAFRRYDGKQWRDQTIGGVYDAQMIACSLSSDKVIATAAAKRNQAIRAMAELFKDEDFDAAVRIGTNTPSRVRYRIQEVRKLLSNLASG
ncbi:DUF262 domain-containing protein [Micromonospora haikouensis]|uniref:DUF262 domain-containing protein n=1 Tax=Micromonospora haikouensis TaxID=686309 RepID=UPI00367FB73C